MRHFKETLRLTVYISAFLLATLLFGFTKLTNSVFIKGHIRKSTKEVAGYISYIVVLVKGDNRILAKTITDSNGDFQLSFTTNEENSFDFYCTSVGIDTMLLASVKKFEKDNSEMTFHLPAKPVKNKAGEVLCPKCKKEDKVFQIIYGDNPIVVRQISISGDTTYSPFYKGKYYEDCSEQPAKYYCDRDKVKF